MFAGGYSAFAFASSSAALAVKLGDEDVVGFALNEGVHHPRSSASFDICCSVSISIAVSNFEHGRHGVNAVRKSKWTTASAVIFGVSTRLSVTSVMNRACLQSRKSV
jgi:hypothetical protein